MAETSIEWTDHSVNPIRARFGDGRGHYCEKVSPGCKNCYSSRLQPRFRMPQFQEQRRANVEHYLDANALESVLRRRKPTKFFWCDMSDMFGDWVPDEWIAACFGVMAATPQHTHQVLTKRAKRMREWFEQATPARIETFKHIALNGRLGEYFSEERTAPIAGWPGYFVTSRGRVLSDRKGPRRELKPMANGDSAHRRVYLYRDEGEHEARMLVHRLVLEAFDRVSVGAEQGRHIDGNPENNALWNLRWGTQSENWDDRRRHGNGRAYHKLTDEQVESIRAQHATGSSMASLAASFGVSATQIKNIVTKRQWVSSAPMPWPLPWVWLGVSAEDQQRADERIPDLLATPAAVRFVSAEPLLGPIEIQEWMPGNGVARTLWHHQRTNHDCSGFGAEGYCEVCRVEFSDDAPALSWLIIGGESGHGARPCRVDWIDSIVEQCRSAGVSCFVKQLGANPTTDPGGRVRFRHRKGGDMSEWPPELRVREFPRATNA